MTPTVTYTEFEAQDFDALLTMAKNVWKGLDTDELKKLMTLKNYKILIAKNTQQHYIGFIMVSVRHDYVEGTKKFPTGYMELLFVEAAYRKQGIAKQLVKLGETWLKENDCTQIGSDTWIISQASREFHKKMGFREEDELVHFIKDME